MRTLIIGLGNPLLRDDGVGFKVAAELHRYLEGHEEIAVAEVAVGGLRLMEMALGYDRVVLIDALFEESGCPGKIHRLSLDDLEAVNPTQHISSAHDTHFITGLRLARSLGLAVPSDWVIYAVEVEAVEDFGETLTPAVAGVLPLLRDAVLQEVGVCSPPG